jgi:hypothetical protein
MTGDGVRWVRVLALASLLFSCGLAGHVAAGGLTPHTPVLIPLFVVTVVAVAQFVGAPTSPARVAVLLVGGQGLLHAALQFGGSTQARMNHLCGAATDVAGISATTSSHHMTHVAAAASHHCATSLMGGAQVIMLLAHLAAGLVVAMWLVVGERALCTLLACTVRPVVDAWRTVTDIARKGIGVTGAGRFARSQPGWVPRHSVRNFVWAATGVSRRGPPPTCCFAEPYAYAAVFTV